jgi:hypothetical protein
MDKRTKKRIAGLRTKLETLRIKLEGARAQEDEPGEVVALEAQITKARADLERLKSSG